MLNYNADVSFSGVVYNVGAFKVEFPLSASAVIFGESSLLTISETTEVKTAKNIILRGSSKITATGKATVLLEANKNGMTRGDFIGIFIENGSGIESGSVIVNGTSGGDGELNVGVFVVGNINSSEGKIELVGVSRDGNGNSGAGVIVSGQITASSNGDVDVIGISNNIIENENENHGVIVIGKSRISSNDGNVTVKGYNGTGGSGVYVTELGLITAGGNVTIIGNDNDKPITGNGSKCNGVYVSNGGKITSSEGKVVVIGTARFAGSNNHGVNVDNNGEIAGGSVEVTGTGSIAGGSLNHGVNVVAAKITSNGGNVTVKGYSGANGMQNSGVNVGPNGQITAGAMGNVTVIGNDEPVTGGGIECHGIEVNRGKIASNGGNVHIHGTGIGNNQSIGVQIADGGGITSENTGKIEVTGTGSAVADSKNYGVFIYGENRGTGVGSTISSGGNDVIITGYGGGTNSDNIGVYVNSCEIKAGGNGTITVKGTGSTTAVENEKGIPNRNHGVLVTGKNGMICALRGNVIVDGMAGGPAESSQNYGVRVGTGAKISSAETGEVMVTGKDGNVAVFVEGIGSQITSNTGKITVIGNAGSGIGDSIGIYCKEGGQIISNGDVITIGTGKTAKKGVSR